MSGRIVLGANQFGKAECRLVKVTRGGSPPDAARHDIEDLTVTTQLRGDFEACHTRGDNSRVVATDTQKNTVYAFAREYGVGTLETFLLRLADHFVEQLESVSGATLSAEKHTWERIAVDGRDHDHAFVRAGRGTRTAAVTRDGDRTSVAAGLQDCTVLKSTGSEFHGFLRDRYTTLPDTTDRILATSLTATWRYRGLDHDFDDLHARITETLLATFAGLHSFALQQTIFEMGKAVLEQYDDVLDITLVCPNKHHFLVDLAPFGLDNPGEVYWAADRPYGRIEATVVREP